MATNDTRFLKIAHFANMTRWSAHGSAFGNVKSRFPLVPLSMVLRRIKEPTTIENEVLYKRITVRNNGRGVVQRDELYGSEIGTKRQFVAHAGQFIISRIDARNGAFGIVPKELEGAIVTNDFWLFKVQKALPEYLMLLLSTKRFQIYWQSQSNGSTNRQRVAEDEFLHSEIILPSIKDQRKLIKTYNRAKGKADKIDERSKRLFYELNKKIEDLLGISYSSAVLEHLLARVNFSCLSRWDPIYLSRRIIVRSSYTMVSIAKVVKNFLVDQDGKPLRRNVNGIKDKHFQYIGMENIERDTGKRTERIVAGSEILSQILSVPKGYVLYGKLRPYLNKYWENTTKDNDIICSPEFLVFTTTGIERKYFMAILASHVIQSQLPPLYSGTRMPRISDESFLNLQIPLPPKHVQKEIAAICERTRKEADRLQETAYKVRQEANNKFEDSVFDNN